MHPAYSIIFFTTVSGAGLGLVALAGLEALAIATGLLGAASPRVPEIALGLVLTALGLVASVFHLGRPERAWRAFREWRTSWLSREAWLAVAVFPLAAGLAWSWYLDAHGARPPTLPVGTPAPGTLGPLTGLLGAASSAAALGTVWATSMIYRSLAAIPRWSTPWVPAAYVALALASGGVWLAFTDAMRTTPAPWPLPLALVLVLGAALVKACYWRATDGQAGGESVGGSTVAGAIGLGGVPGVGAVRLLEPPHTGPAYLQQEMGYRVARRHARRLRELFWLLGLGIPVQMLALAWAMDGTFEGAGAQVAALLAAGSLSAGVLIERWLFFAEAEHRVSLYYRRHGPAEEESTPPGGG